VCLQGLDQPQGPAQRARMMDPAHVICVDADIVPGTCSSSGARHGRAAHENDDDISSQAAENGMNQGTEMTENALLALNLHRSKSFSDLERAVYLKSGPSLSPSRARAHRPASPSYSSNSRLSRQWLSRTLDDITDNSWACHAEQHDGNGHYDCAKDSERQHPVRFGFSGLASAAEGAASLAQTANLKMKKMASRIHVLRWLKHDADGEESCKLGTESQAEDNEHKGYGGSLTFPLVRYQACVANLVNNTATMFKYISPLIYF
jgi:hypothetical protein